MTSLAQNEKCPETHCSTGDLEMADGVAIWIEKADVGNRHGE